MQYIVDRYGEYALLNPRATGANWILWLAGPGMLLIGGGIAALYLRSRARAKAVADDDLSPEEAARLRTLLEE